MSYKISYGDHNITRPDRNRFCAEILQSKEAKGSVLNIGSGGEEFLKQNLPDLKITDIDICGKVDHVINLETDLPLPFENNSYETVICLDVLEHIDTFHSVFEEILRISSKNIILSLPNCSANYFQNLILNRQPFADKRHEFGKYEKFYGIPYQRPVDRHKWFFCFDEAIEFFEHHAPGKYFIEEIIYPGKGGFKHQVVNTLAPRLYRNLVPLAFWIVIRKTV